MAASTDDLIRFDNRVVLVTGAGRGLGRAYALALAGRGAHVIVHDAGVERDGSGGDPSVASGVVEEITSLGGDATAAYQNLERREACRELVAQAVDEQGRLDAVVLNAGIVRYDGLEATTPETWRRILRIQLEASLWISQAALPVLKARSYGRFVLTVSGHGLQRTGDPLAAYAVAKAGTFGLMNVLADEGEERGILANAISPVAATRMYRRKVAEGELLPGHAAPAVVYLASEACSVSGVVLGAAGGRFSVGSYVVSRRTELGPEPATPEAVAEALQLQQIRSSE